ncbi:alpha-L-rhamnosidase-like protein [Favolaschia claudopus]|uniref:Alpha-L-rhamnosidase-like protein n=1 Tax=Favolaschia claudopus TaxID=2862362 RepID=A0AAW0DM59_9AGAR
MRLSALFALLPAVAFAAGSNFEEDFFDLETFDNAQVSSLSHWQNIANQHRRHLCLILPKSNGGDDAANIADHLNGPCRRDSLVVLPGQTYNMSTNINTTNLDNVQIHLFGRLLWTPDVDYWLSVSMPIDFQNQSTVWYFGGNNVHWDGHGVGTLDGNGQVWYDWANGRGNLPHRPMMINWRGLNNSVVRRQRFVQSQMWTMATTYSNNILFEDFYINNTANNGQSTLNTDGIDTIWSNNVTLRRWDVTCGDDHVALKRNSTNIYVYDAVFRRGQGFAIGSLAQYNGETDIVDTFYARNITLSDTTYAIYFKTWGGRQQGFPPNGGGGGLGYATNITIEDIVLDRGRNTPIWVWQCENYEGQAGKDCDSSQFSFNNLNFRRLSGTMNDGVVAAAKLRCSSAAGGCSGLTVEDFSVTNVSNDTVLSDWWCHNVNGEEGFACEDFPPGEL